MHVCAVIRQEVARSKRVERRSGGATPCAGRGRCGGAHRVGAQAARAVALRTPMCRAARLCSGVCPEVSIVMSAYFLGFLGGSRIAPEMIRRVGHVRVFSALGSMISAVLRLRLKPWRPVEQKVHSSAQPT